jgi:hypothetical protein
MKCNKCGKDFKDEGRYTEFYSPFLHKITITFGYGSKRDMETWEFYKCESCLIEEVENFSILPKIQNYELFIQ